MRGVEVSELELGTDGGITVKSLATIFADGEVIGASYLASSLRKEVETRGPLDMERVLRLYNSGYYGASLLTKGRVYLKEGQEAPTGIQVTEGPRGGRYYETRAGRGRPLGEAPKGWKPKEGARVRLRMPGDKRNGRLGKIQTIERQEGKLWATVEGIGWKGGAYLSISAGQLVPAPYTAKEKKEMTARDILIAEFGKTTRRYDVYEESGIHMASIDHITHLEYDVFDTEAGPALWIRAEPREDKPWAATKESAVSLKSFMKALPEMSTEALQTMKHEVRKIIFSPIGNPTDRKTSQTIGAKFTSAASIVMASRVMHIYPKSKGVDAKRLAGILTHETGHAQDDADLQLGIAYSRKLDEFWRTYRGDIPADPGAVEEAEGIPPHPRAWIDDWGRWVDYDLGTKTPDRPRYWRALGEMKAWNALSVKEQIVIRKSTNGTAPVSKYANTSEFEYYAEAYQVYHEGRLPETHVMFQHFENLGEVKTWVQQ